MKRKNQICFQGNCSKKNYFEGWYYKQVTASKKISVSIIPGISTNKADEHSFIQVIENMTNQSYYIRFPLSDFSSTDEPFSIRIGDNYFSKDQMILSLHTDTLNLDCDLYFSELTPIETSLMSPTIMGPFSYIPMQCNHGIMSMNHFIDGMMTFNGTEIDFEDGLGYMEKDYGTSFPKEYMWLQSNTLKKDNLDYKKASIILSVAHIPMLFYHFKGFLCILLVNDTEYRFTTYNGTRIRKIDKKHSDVHYIELKKRNETLYIHFKSNQKQLLKSPLNGQMKEEIEESLNGTCYVVLKKKGKIIFKQHFVACGCEVVETKKDISV